MMAVLWSMIIHIYLNRSLLVVTKTMNARAMSPETNAHRLERMRSGRRYFEVVLLSETDSPMRMGVINFIPTSFRLIS